MQFIDKGDGTGTGDSVRQSLLKAADNFVELDARVAEIEARGFPKKVRGWSGPVGGFPQPPSTKGSAWTGATRVGSQAFIGHFLYAGLLPMPSGRLLAFSGGTTGYVQLLSVEPHGALTALGAPVQIAPGTSGPMAAAAIGDNLALIIVSSTNGSVPIRIVIDTSGGAAAVVSTTALSSSAPAARAAFNPRSMRTVNTSVSVHTENATGLAGLLLRQMSAVSAESTPRDHRPLPFRASSATSPAQITHDLLGYDAAIGVSTETKYDGTNELVAFIAACSDAGADLIGRLSLGSGTTNSPSVIALSAVRAIVRPGVAYGAFGLNINDGQLELLSSELQTAGILGRAWTAVCQQDDERALVFEQSTTNLVPPTIIRVDPITGIFAEEGTVPILFGSSNAGTPSDVVKIGPNRIAITGRADAGSSTNIQVEIWDLS